MTHVDDELAPFCEGVLPEDAARAVRDHLLRCPACRAAEAEVRRGVAWARALDPVALPAPDAVRILQVVSAARGWKPRRWPVVAAAAAAFVCVAWGALHATRGRLTLEQAPGAPTRFEQAALDLHDAHAADRLIFGLRSSSVPDVRRWAEEHARLGVNLAAARPPEDGGRFALEGAALIEAAGRPALAVAYRVDGRPVTLLTARDRDVPDRTPEWTFGGKRVRFRSVGRRKLLTWTNSGQAYVLVSEAPDHGQEACLLCHTDPSRRAQIRGLGGR